MYINVKLPNHIVTIFLPPMTATRQQNNQLYNRDLSDADTRVTSDGSTRIVDDVIYSYPEVAAVKLPAHVINVEVRS